MQIDFESAEGPRALRLTFRYEGQRVEMIDQEELAMVIPPHEELPTEGEVSGFWYELQDTEEATVYRHLVRNPMPTHVEVPTGDPSEPLAYTAVDRPSGIFSIVVPDVPEARSVVLFGSRPPEAFEGVQEDQLRAEPELRAGAARELARFEIR